MAWVSNNRRVDVVDGMWMIELHVDLGLLDDDRNILGSRAVHAEESVCRIHLFVPAYWYLDMQTTGSCHFSLVDAGLSEHLLPYYLKLFWSMLWYKDT
jgi:hypothetical protein